MEVGQGPNWGCSANGKKITDGRVLRNTPLKLFHVARYTCIYIVSRRSLQAFKQYKGSASTIRMYVMLVLLIKWIY
jgi:hypothetical protein